MLINFCRAPWDMMNPDEIPLDESDFSRLTLHDPPVDQQLFEEGGVTEPQACPTSLTWGPSPWMSDATYQILKPGTPPPAAVSSFCSQEPIHPTTDARELSEGWAVPFPFEAGFDVSTSIVHSDANIRFLSAGGLLPAEQHQDILYLGTHLRCNRIK